MHNDITGKKWYAKTRNLKHNKVRGASNNSCLQPINSTKKQVQSCQHALQDTLPQKRIFKSFHWHKMYQGGQKQK